MNAPYYDKQTWLRLALKVLAILIVVNVLYIAVRPYDAVVPYSIIGRVVPLRKRIILPAREEQAQLGPVEMLLNAHEISQPKAPDEFRVVVLGDSGINGWGLGDDQTINAYLTTMGVDLQGRKVRAYNLAYVGFNATRDLLIADAALAYQPDLILWFVTLNTFIETEPDRLIAFNQVRMTRLTTQFQLSDLNAQRFGHYENSWWQQSLFSQRADIFQWINFQSYALRQSQFSGMDSNLIRDHLSDQYLIAPDAPTSLPMPNQNWLPLTALSQLSSTPVFIVNEPIYIAADSANTYNSFYGKTLYDQYRQAFTSFCNENHLWCLDLWNSLSPSDFTDSPVHHSAHGNQTLASQVGDEIVRKLGTK
jgi:hypothetical protein